MTTLRLLLLSTFVCIFTSTTVFSQPANNAPADAVTLTVGSGSCSGNTAGTTVDATLSSAPKPTCDNGAVFSDVWYKAVVPASGNLAIETFDVGDTSFDAVLTVYSGTPSGGLTEVICEGQGGEMNIRLAKAVFRGQAAGTTLYIRVWGWNGNRAPFEICAWEPMDLPTNDDPADAMALTVGSDSCGGNTAGSTESATSSSNVPTPNCGFDVSSDVWYKAVVPASGDLAIETFNVSGGDFNTVLTVYSGTPTSLTQVACDNDGSGSTLSKVALTGQTAGTTLYIRVWGYQGDRDPFEICVWEPAQVTNDDPADATMLTVGSGSCGGNTAGSTEIATLSSNVPTPSCDNGAVSSDVWYKAVVPASGNLAIETFNVAGRSFDAVLTVYSGTPSGGLTEVICEGQGGELDIRLAKCLGAKRRVLRFIFVFGVGMIETHLKYALGILCYLLTITLPMRWL